MVEHTHYFPILRWKRGEYIALRHLRGADRAGMTPLVELVPGTRPWGGDETPQRVEALVSQIEQSWGTAPLLLDPQHLALETSPASVLTNVWEAMPQQLQLVPVVGLARTSDYFSAVQSALDIAGRVALRIQGSELRRPDISQCVSELLERLQITQENVYLVIDLAYFPDRASPYPSLNELARRLPRWDAWYAVVLASGAFPANLTDFQPGQHLHPRSDWRAWRRLINGENEARRPAYGDYATLHAIYSTPPPRANPSASIRYTASTNWVVMRGEGVRTPTGSGFAQWPANAQLLCERDEFCGADFSYGDAYISEIADQVEHTGNPETWLRAGVNHHLTFVVRQIANLGDAEGNGGP